MDELAHKGKSHQEPRALREIWITEEESRGSIGELNQRRDGVDIVEAKRKDDRHRSRSGPRYGHRDDYGRRDSSRGRY